MRALLCKVTCLHEVAVLAEGTIAWLHDRGDMAILLVEQYFDFAREPADSWHVMDRGEVTLSGTRATMDAEEVRRRMSV